MSLVFCLHFLLSPPRPLQLTAVVMVILNPEVFDSGTGSQVDVDASAILEVAEDRTQVSYSTSELVKSGLAKLTNVLATHGDYNKEQEGEQNYSGVAEELKQKLDA